MHSILSTIKWICKHVYSFNKNMKNAWYTVLIINCKKNIYIYIYLWYNNKFTTKLYFCYSWSCLLLISLFPTNISSLLLLSIFFWSLSNQFYNKIVIVIFDWTIFFQIKWATIKYLRSYIVVTMTTYTTQNMKNTLYK